MFRFGRNRDFLALLSLPLPGGPREGKRFNASWWLISPASFHTSSDNRERNTQKWNSNNKDYVRKKPLRHGCGWQMLRNKLRKAQCFATTRWKTFKKTSLRPLKSSRQVLHVLRNECNEIVILCLSNLCDASSRWDWIFIFIFRNFEARTPASIAGLGFATNWPLTRVPQHESCFKSERNELFGSRGGRASDKIAISPRAASQILNKAKDFFESLKYYLRMQPTNLGRRCGPEGNLVASVWQFNCLLKKEQMLLARAYNRITVPLRDPLRAWGRLSLSLVWISKPVVSRLRGKPYRCGYFTTDFSLFYVVVVVSTHLSVACHHFCSIVAAQRLCPLSEFTLTELLP